MLWKIHLTLRTPSTILKLFKSIKSYNFTSFHCFYLKFVLKKRQHVVGYRKNSNIVEWRKIYSEQFTTWK